MRGSIQNRVAKQGVGRRGCAVLYCGRLTAASEGSGLHKAYCRAHAEHFRRHGSYSKPSYTACQLAPYRDRAVAWLEEHREDAAVRQGLEQIRVLYRSAGLQEYAFSLAGKEPAVRASALWARLRDRKVDPLAILAVWSSVQECHSDDPQPERSLEYRHVQSAKILHRMAGGSHKSWGGYGGVPKVDLHKYPASRGKVLRHVGRQLERASSSIPNELLFT